MVSLQKFYKDTTKCGVLVNIFSKKPKFLLPYSGYPHHLIEDEKEEDWKVINVLEVLPRCSYLGVNENRVLIKNFKLSNCSDYVMQVVKQDGNLKPTFYSIKEQTFNSWVIP